jgi:hypothetical protein
MTASSRVPRAEPIRRLVVAACLLFPLASCVTQPPDQPVERGEVQELPASRFPAPSEDPGAYETAAELMQAFQRKIRRNLVLPPGRFPTSTKVTVKVMVSSEARFSDWSSADRAVFAS